MSTNNNADDDALSSFSSEEEDASVSSIEEQERPKQYDDRVSLSEEKEEDEDDNRDAEDSFIERDEDESEQEEEEEEDDLTDEEENADMEVNAETSEEIRRLDAAAFRKEKKKKTSSNNSKNSSKRGAILDDKNTTPVAFVELKYEEDNFGNKGYVLASVLSSMTISCPWLQNEHPGAEPYLQSVFKYHDITRFGPKKPPKDTGTGSNDEDQDPSAPSEENEEDYGRKIGGDNADGTYALLDKLWTYEYKSINLIPKDISNPQSAARNFKGNKNVIVIAPKPFTNDFGGLYPSPWTSSFCVITPMFNAKTASITGDKVNKRQNNVYRILATVGVHHAQRPAVTITEIANYLGNRYGPTLAPYTAKKVKDRFRYKSASTGKTLRGKFPDRSEIALSLERIEKSLSRNSPVDLEILKSCQHAFRSQIYVKLWLVFYNNSRAMSFLRCIKNDQRTLNAIWDVFRKQGPIVFLVPEISTNTSIYMHLQNLQCGINATAIAHLMSVWETLCLFAERSRLGGDVEIDAADDPHVHNALLSTIRQRHRSVVEQLESAYLVLSSVVPNLKAASLKESHKWFDDSAPMQLLSLRDVFFARGLLDLVPGELFDWNLRSIHPKFKDTFKAISEGTHINEVDNSQLQESTLAIRSSRKVLEFVTRSLYQVGVEPQLFGYDAIVAELEKKPKTRINTSSLHLLDLRSSISETCQHLVENFKAKENQRSVWVHIVPSWQHLFGDWSYLEKESKDKPQYDHVVIAMQDYLSLRESQSSSNIFVRCPRTKAPKPTASAEKVLEEENEKEKVKVQNSSSSSPMVVEKQNVQELSEDDDSSAGLSDDDEEVVEHKKKAKYVTGQQSKKRLKMSSLSTKRSLRQQESTFTHVNFQPGRREMKRLYKNGGPPCLVFPARDHGSATYKKNSASLLRKFQSIVFPNDYLVNSNVVVWDAGHIDPYLTGCLFNRLPWNTQLTIAITRVSSPYGLQMSSFWHHMLHSVQHRNSKSNTRHPTGDIDMRYQKNGSAETTADSFPDPVFKLPLKFSHAFLNDCFTKHSVMVREPRTNFHLIGFLVEQLRKGFEEVCAAQPVLKQKADFFNRHIVRIAEGKSTRDNGIKYFPWHWYKRHLEKLQQTDFTSLWLRIIGQTLLRVRIIAVSRFGARKRVTEALYTAYRNALAIFVETEIKNRKHKDSDVIKLFHRGKQSSDEMNQDDEEPEKQETTTATNDPPPFIQYKPHEVFVWIPNLVETLKTPLARFSADRFRVGDTVWFDTHQNEDYFLGFTQCSRYLTNYRVCQKDFIVDNSEPGASSELKYNYGVDSSGAWQRMYSTEKDLVLKGRTGVVVAIWKERQGDIYELYPEPTAGDYGTDGRHPIASGFRNNKRHFMQVVFPSALKGQSALGAHMSPHLGGGNGAQECYFTSVVVPLTCATKFKHAINLDVGLMQDQGFVSSSVVTYSHINTYNVGSKLSYLNTRMHKGYDPTNVLLLDIPVQLEKKKSHICFKDLEECRNDSERTELRHMGDSQDEYLEQLNRQMEKSFGESESTNITETLMKAMKKSDRWKRLIQKATDYTLQVEKLCEITNNPSSTSNVFSSADSVFECKVKGKK